MNESIDRSRTTSTLVYYRVVLTALFLLAVGCATPPQSQHSWPATPAQLYGQLFSDVQMAHVFADSKSFVDAAPKRSPVEIVAAYEHDRRAAGFDLQQFVLREFNSPQVSASDYHTLPGESVSAHIDRLWPVLTRQPVTEPAYSSRLSLPQRYVVPGGRFNEMYYWDSYFTMLGLRASGEHDLVRAMCDDFAFLIQRYGHIPNGTRTYYLSRSQPPFFAAMVELLALHDGPGTYARYADALQKEYDFWMEGSERLSSDRAHRRVVRLADGTVLNRYWDDLATPREESYQEDLATAQASTRAPEEIYRNLRAAAESGWDFSSRWFADGKTLGSIRTVELLPVDLNSLLYQLELTLARAHESGDAARANDLRARAASRRSAIQRYLWNPAVGAFTDYAWSEGRAGTQVTAATVAPLFFGVASADQANAVAVTISSTLLATHGLLTTTHATGQQWDAPNGWAPLQWMAIDGLRRYHQDALAESIAKRWIARNVAVFNATGKLVEKYDVVSGGGTGGGGEYPLQDGFGWTNGVLRALLEVYPPE
ncbi:MAG TPA: alpha,alpha-trehalase TreF [Povalibacter sp.]